MVHLSDIIPNLIGYNLMSQSISLRFLEVLGTGAYGVVYLAHDLSTPHYNPKFYAVKCLLRHEKGSTLHLAQEREIFLHSSMSHHPNVVTLHHVIAEQHFVYLVMDFCPGGDLFSAIMDRGTFDRKDVAIKQAFVQLLDAMEACHEMGIYHRDLKPENILCAVNDDQFYITDFGLATESELSCTFGCGSSGYMSPECIKITIPPAPYSTETSDIWCLGIILVNIITGRNPWHIASPGEDEGYREFLRDGASFLRRVLPLSRGASKLLARALDPNPETRIKISELRERVISMDTFFPPADVPDYIRIADTSFEASLKGRADDDDVTPSPHTADLYVPPPTAPIAIPPPTAEILPSAYVAHSPNRGIDIGAFPMPPPIVHSRSTSADDSVGPITPVTQAQDPSVAIPGLTLTAEQSGEGLPWLALSPVKPPAGLLANSKIPRSVHRFMGVMQGLKVRSSHLLEGFGQAT